MGTTRKRSLSLAASNPLRRYVNTDYFIEEHDDVLISQLSAMMGRDPSHIMNEAIGELIRRYRPASSGRTTRLKLIKS